MDSSATTEQERLLKGALLEASVHEAEAQYWIAYRLAFLFAEDPIVVPLDRKQDRYPPYRARVDAAASRALVFHSSEPRAQAASFEDELRASGRPYERKDVGGYTILFVPR